MADSLYISPVARWMAENGYVASLLKGSPYSTHAKQPGSPEITACHGQRFTSIAAWCSRATIERK